MTKWSSLSGWALVALLALGLGGCPSSKNSSSTGKTGKTDARPDVRTPALKVQSNWKSSHWVAKVRKNPKLILDLFRSLPKQDPKAYQDLQALQKNRVRRALLQKGTLGAKTTDFQRILRARLHLRRARYFQMSYDYAMSLALEVYGRRSALAKRIKLGKMFRYYYGRLLCLNNDKAGVAQLDKALAEAPKAMHGRVQLWKTLCVEKDPAKIKATLSKVKFGMDLRGWAEVHFFLLRSGLSLKKNPDADTPRAQLFAAARKTDWFWPQASALRDPVDKEIIQEGSFKGELKFFDPAVMKAMVHYHSNVALKVLKGLKKKQAMDTLLQADALLLLGQSTKATALFKGLVTKPPKSWNLTHLFFSRFLSGADVLDYARFQLANLSSGKEKDALVAALEKKGLPSSVLAVLLKPSKGTAETFEEAVQWLSDEVSRYRKELKKALDKKEDGAQLVLQNGLHTYLPRPMMQWASYGALQQKKAYLAVRWMESLHHKAAPYKIEKRNQADQIVLTAYAYTQAGKLSVATEFCLKNRKLYPVMNQHWELLGTLRILRGMGGGVVKGG